MSDAAHHIDLHTGAWRREYFEDQLGQVLSNQRRLKQQIALIRVDVDDLQEHNDTHGRDTLDSALAELVQTIAGCVDGKGPIGRLGGDDFAVLLTDTTQEQAMKIAQAIRQEAGQTEHASTVGRFRLTVSVGVALSRPGEPSGTPLEAAEAACTKAKQGGRNALVKR